MYNSNMKSLGFVAQSVEQETFNLLVESSNLSEPTKKRNTKKQAKKVVKRNSVM